MALAVFTGLFFFFLIMTVYAVKYFIRGGKSFLVAMPGSILFIILILMFPGIYQEYKSAAFWTLWILTLIGILIFFIAIFRK